MLLFECRDTKYNYLTNMNFKMLYDSEKSIVDNTGRTPLMKLCQDMQ